METRITEKEIEVINATGDVMNKFKEVPVLHPDDINDVKFHIHAIQNIILSRSAYRELHKIPPQ